jgi:hypothetical protein
MGRRVSERLRRHCLLGTSASSTARSLLLMMARMGHDSERAAMIYLHEMRGADRAIARAIDAHVNAERQRHDDDRPAR